MKTGRSGYVVWQNIDQTFTKVVKFREILHDIRETGRLLTSPMPKNRAVMAQKQHELDLRLNGKFFIMAKKTSHSTEMRIVNVEARNDAHLENGFKAITPPDTYCRTMLDFDRRSKMIAKSHSKRFEG